MKVIICIKTSFVILQENLSHSLKSFWDAKQRESLHLQLAASNGYSLDLTECC